MADEEKRVWGIHTKDDNLFLQKDVIAIGWKEIGNLSKIKAERDAFKEKYAQVYPEAKREVLRTEQGCCIGLSAKYRLVIM